MSDKYEKFRSLLKYGMGDSSVTDFANRSGVSRVSLSRMLNSDDIGKPQEETLIKLADAMNGRVLRDDLLESCGYARTDVRANLMKTHEELKTATSEYFTKSVIFNDVEDILGAFDLLYFSHDIRWYTGAPVNPDDTIKKRVIEGRWNEGDFEYRIIFGLEYVVADSGKICVIKTHTEYDDMVRFAADDRAMKVIIRNAEHSQVSTEAVGFAERRDVKLANPTAEDILLRNIFGHENGERYEVILSGVGVTYNETPEGFVDFLNEYKDVFCVNEENTKLYQKVISGENPDEVFREYTFDELNEGTGEAVAFIMSKVTGEHFSYAPDETDSNDGCVACMLGENAFGSPEISSDLLLSDIREMATILRPLSCGVVYHKEIASKDDRIYSPDEPFDREATKAVPYSEIEKIKKNADEYSDKVMGKINKMTIEDTIKDINNPKSINIGGFCNDLAYLLNKYKGKSKVQVPWHLYDRFKDFE